MSNTMTSLGHSSPPFQTIRKHPDTLPSALPERSSSSRRLAFGRVITSESTTTKTIPPTPSLLSRIHQRRTESTESAKSTDSTGSTHPNYTEYRVLYEELTEKYRNQNPFCGIGGICSSSQRSQQERSPLELFSSPIRGTLSTTSFKAHLIDRIEPYFKQLRDQPITLTGDIQRLRCFIKITLLIYCQYKKRCFDSNNMLKRKFEENFEQIDKLHLQLYGNIFSRLVPKDKTITDILKEETLPRTVLTEGCSNLHPTYLEKISTESSHFRASYQSFYPPFIVDLMCGRKSEKRIFESVATQLSVESAGSSQHSGIVDFKTAGPASTAVMKADTEYEVFQDSCPKN